MAEFDSGEFRRSQPAVAAQLGLLTVDSHSLDIVTAAGRMVVQAEVTVAVGRGVAGGPGSRFAVARGFVDQHVEDRWVLDLPWHGSAERSAAPVGYRIRS